MLSLFKPTAWFLETLFVFGAVSMAYAADSSDPPIPSAPKAPPAHHKSHVAQKKAPAPLVLPPLPPGPLQQVPMDKIPAAAPQVTFENGQLKIVAENATLGSILKDVRRLTGASIDLPANGAPERVVTNIGPGAPRDVLALLLNGTQFNYVMLGSSSDPSAVATVVLSPKPSSGETQTVANAVPPGQPNGMSPPQPFRQQMLANQQAQAESADDADDDKADDPENPPAPPPQAEAQPDPNNSNSGDQANQPNHPTCRFQNSLQSNP